MKLKDENQTGKITGQHSPDLGQALEHLPHIRHFYNKSLPRIFFGLSRSTRCRCDRKHYCKHV
jgi:hypothetical protein